MREFPAEIVLGELVSKLDRLRLRYAIGGSTASSVWGKPRFTNDIGISLEMAQEDLRRLIDEFSDGYMVNVGEFEEALRSKSEYRTAQLMHIGHVFKIDVFLSGDDEYAQQCLGRARDVLVSEGVRARVLSPEDVVISKLRWYEMGGRMINTQWNDLVQVIEVQRNEFDEDYLMSWARVFGVEELAREALAEADR